MPEEKPKAAPSAKFYEATIDEIRYLVYAQTKAEVKAWVESRLTFAVNPATPEQIYHHIKQRRNDFIDLVNPNLIDPFAITDDYNETHKCEECEEGDDLGRSLLEFAE